MQKREFKQNRTLNKKKILVLVLVIFVVLVSVSSFFVIPKVKEILHEKQVQARIEGEKQAKLHKEKREKERAAEKEKFVTSQIDELVENMTLEKKVGQMMVVSVPGRSLNDSVKKELKKINPSGVILMGNNYSSYDGTLRFVRDLKKTSNIPLLISTDQEGGIVQRLQSLQGTTVKSIPSMRELGKKNDTKLAYSVGEIMAKQLRTLEINLTFTPVVDVLTNTNNEVIGDRAFSSNKDVVSKLASSLSKGIEENGVNTCFKHFPGHGGTSVDSHYSMPVITKSEKELEQIELVPFKKAIAEDAKMIMIGHLAVPKITKSQIPASLSKILITDLLKEKLQFKGIVITDALNMGAITENYTTKDIATKSINAGVDLLLLPSNNLETHSAIIDVVKSDKVKIEKIDESVKKILRYKYDNIQEKSNSNYLDKSYLNREEYSKVLDKI